MPAEGLHGHGISLIPLTEAHLDALFACSRDPLIWVYLPHDTLPDREQLKVLIDQAIEQRRLGTRFPFVIRKEPEGRVVGSTSYLDLNPSHRTLEIGWTWLDPGVWRTSVNSAAKLHLLTYAFEQLGVNRVTLKTDARNIRSQTAIERIGGVREGVMRQHAILASGYVRDTVHFGILREGWPRVKARLEAALGGQRR